MNESEELDPIIAYTRERLLSLAKACTTLVGIVHNMFYYVPIALQTTSNEPAHGLTCDKSASIRL